MGMHTGLDWNLVTQDGLVSTLQADQGFLVALCSGTLGNQETTACRVSITRPK